MANKHMANPATIRRLVELELADRIPAALTPRTSVERPRVPTGVAAADELVGGGLPLGAMTELAGPECSGRTSLALSFVAEVAGVDRVCAWVDAMDALSPESAAAAGVALERLLWVRCGVGGHVSAPHTAVLQPLPEACFAASAPIHGLHGGGFGPHPRTEGRGMPAAVAGLLGQADAARAGEPVAIFPGVIRLGATSFPAPFAGKGGILMLDLPSTPAPSAQNAGNQMPSPANPSRRRVTQPWARIDQALRATDLLLGAGGFAAVVLDLAGVAPEVALRIPLATWFRYRAAAERAQVALVVLTQTPCAKSSAGLVLRFEAGAEAGGQATVFAGLGCHVEVLRQRYVPAPQKVVPLRKPPARANVAGWQTRAAWAGGR